MRLYLRLANCCPNLSMGTTFMTTGNSKKNEPYKSLLNFLQILDLRRSDKHVTPQNL